MSVLLVEIVIDFIHLRAVFKGGGYGLKPPPSPEIMTRKKN